MAISVFFTSLQSDLFDPFHTGIRTLLATTLVDIFAIFCGLACFPFKDGLQDPSQANYFFNSINVVLKGAG